MKSGRGSGIRTLREAVVETCPPQYWSLQMGWPLRGVSELKEEVRGDEGRGGLTCDFEESSISVEGRLGSAGAAA